MPPSTDSDLQSHIGRALANPGLAMLELDRLDCEDSLITFLEGGWRYIDPARFSRAWHLEAVAEHLEAVTRGDIRNLLINIPPRMTKSLLVSVAWPAWTWAQRVVNSSLPLSGPHVQFLHSSYAQQLALRDSVRTRRLISSPWYQERWGDRFELAGDQNVKQRFENTKGGYRLATSTGGALTGEGGDVIVVDDPHNALEMESEAIIESTTQWWDESLSTRLNNSSWGAFVVVMQRLSSKDISGHILSQNTGEWTHLMLPMEYEPRRKCYTSIGFEDPRTREGELLAPERIDHEALALLKKKLGPYGTAGQFQQSPVPRGGAIIKEDWWQVWPPEGELIDPVGKPVNPLSYPNMDYILASLDTALTEKEENDESALTVWGIWRNKQDLPQIMLMEAWAEHLEFHSLISKVMATCGKRRIDKLIVEGKQNGHSVVQEINRLLRGQDYMVQTEPVKGDKIARAHSCVPTFAAGQVWAPDRKWAQRVIDQCAAFPRGDGKDLVDSTTQAINHMRRAGLLLNREERQDELRRRLGPGPAAGRREAMYDV